MTTLIESKGRLTDPDYILSYITAGKATITLVSHKTEARFTYKISRPNENSPYFVKLLNGPDNYENYVFLGTIFPDGFRHGRKSNITESAPSSKAFSWFYGLLAEGRVSEHIEVWHEGKCGRCGRKLTVPESISIGMGPECSARLLPFEG